MPEEELEGNDSTDTIANRALAAGLRLFNQTQVSPVF